MIRVSATLITIPNSRRGDVVNASSHAHTCNMYIIEIKSVSSYLVKRFCTPCSVRSCDSAYVCVCVMALGEAPDQERVRGDFRLARGRQGDLLGEKDSAGI